MYTRLQTMKIYYIFLNMMLYITNCKVCFLISYFIAFFCKSKDIKVTQDLRLIFSSTVLFFSQR